MALSTTKIDLNRSSTGVTPPRASPPKCCRE